MKLIPLTQNRSAMVDDSDFDELMKCKWFAHWNRDTLSFYARRNSVKVNRKQSTISMHRVILGLTNPKIKGDHKNHDTLDNQRDNLRAVTNSQNLMNRRGAARNSKTGVRGVSADGPSYRALIWVGGKNLNLGTFPTIALASEAYASANKKYYGEHGGQF